MRDSEKGITEDWEQVCVWQRGTLREREEERFCEAQDLKKGIQKESRAGAHVCLCVCVRDEERQRVCVNVMCVAPTAS